MKKFTITLTAKQVKALQALCITPYDTAGDVRLTDPDGEYPRPTAFARYARELADECDALVEMVEEIILEPLRDNDGRLKLDDA